MEPPNSGEITTLLRDLRNGEPGAESKLIPLVYPELRKLADRYMRRERPGHTLQPTALVNELYLRLMEQGQDSENRAHFYAIAAGLMRQILVDHARRHRSAKRGGGAPRVELDDSFNVGRYDQETLLDIDDAIEQLAKLDQRQAVIVVERFFGGLTEEEIALVHGISARTVKREWSSARAWLRRMLRKSINCDDA